MNTSIYARLIYEGLDLAVVSMYTVGQFGSG